MSDLSMPYLGLPLRNPLVCASSRYLDLDALRRMRDGVFRFLDHCWPGGYARMAWPHIAWKPRSL